MNVYKVSASTHPAWEWSNYVVTDSTGRVIARTRSYEGALAVAEAERETDSLIQHLAHRAQS